MDWDRMNVGPSPEPPIDNDALLSRTSERIAELSRKRTRRRRATAGVLASAAVAAVAFGIAQQDPSATVSTSNTDGLTSSNPQATSSTPSMEPQTDMCRELPPAAADNGFDINLDVTRHIDGTISGIASIHNNGVGSARLTLTGGVVDVFPVDDNGRPTAGPDPLATAPLLRDLHEGESLEAPVKLVTGPCETTRGTSRYVAVIRGLRNEIPFEVSSPPTEAGPT